MEIKDIMEDFVKSSLRYVDKVSANPEMSHNKILSRIKSGTKVLEVGPSHGAMTRILSEEMNCEVHIVEIDEDCFESASRYAKDGICANIEDTSVLDKFGSMKFDYIVFADVLEHLTNSVDVLRAVKNLLKDDGSVLISVPNMAHNSVIIQLLNNQLMYQNTGILDYTHVHYFTYEELKKMYQDAGYDGVYVDATYIAVGKNEFDIIYEDTSFEVAEYLRNRPLGEVYQYIVEIKKKEIVTKNDIECDCMLGENIEYVNLDGKVAGNGEKPNYLFATNKEIAKVRLELNDVYDALAEKRDIKLIKDELHQAQIDIKSRNVHIAKLDSEIDEKNSYIKILQNEQQENEEALTLAKAELAEVQQKNELLENEHNELKSSLAKLEETNLLYSDKILYLEHEVEDCKKIIEEHDKKEWYDKAYVDDLKLLLSNKEGHIEQLLEAERAWEREKQSPSYQKILRKRARRDKIFPKNSKRRFFLDVLYQCFRNPRVMIKIITPHKIKTFLKVLKHDGMSAVNGIYQENLRVSTSMQESVAVVNNTTETEKEISYSIADFEKIYFTKWNNPTVSIVIPVYNEFVYTYNCLKSILKNTGDVKYEVLIANDCSTDCTSEVEKVAENVRLITTEHNCRFLLNCNNAAKYAQGKYIFFLNNDTQVKENWLQPLIDLIESDEKIGMVGSKLVYPDGLLQEAGGILWKDGSAWNYGNRKDADASEYNYVKEADYISGAAIMIKTDLWNEIGGFDERFAPAYCEDSDLAFEVRKHGFKVLYQPKSEIVHFEGVSNGTDVNFGLKSYQVENSKKFYEKWKDVLEKEHFENAQNVFQARDKSAGKKCILFIDHYVPQFDKDAGSRTVFAYLKLFVSKGYNVKFIGDNYYRHEPYTEILQQMGIEVLYGPHYAQHWKDWIKENAAAFDYIFLNRPHISETYIDYVKAETNAKIIYYGHDLHYVRETREYELTGDKALLKSAEEWKKREFSLMEKADSVYYPSEVEVAEIKKVHPEINAAALTAYIYDTVTERPYISDERKNLLFVGGFGHGPNIDAVKWFCTDIFPKVLNNNPDIKFEIVGSNAPDEILALNSDNIIVHGFVSDEKLEELYGSCKMAVIPLRYGAGIKGKVVEAMSQGVPVITTAVGAEGIVDAENILFVKNDIDEIVDAIVELYDDSKALSEVADKSYEYIRKYFSADAAWESICKDFV